MRRIVLLKIFERSALLKRLDLAKIEEDLHKNRSITGSFDSVILNAIFICSLIAIYHSNEIFDLLETEITIFIIFIRLQLYYIIERLSFFIFIFSEFSHLFNLIVFLVIQNNNLRKNVFNK